MSPDTSWSTRRSCMTEADCAGPPRWGSSPPLGLRLWSTCVLVTVESSPTSPLQLCMVADGVGTVAATDVMNVDVTCVSGWPKSAPG